MEHEVIYEPRLLDPPLPQGGKPRSVTWLPRCRPLSLPVFGRQGAEVVDSSSLRFLTATALQQREVEERQKGVGGA